MAAREKQAFGPVSQRTMRTSERGRISLRTHTCANTQIHTLTLANGNTHSHTSVTTLKEVKPRLLATRQPLKAFLKRPM